MMLASLQLAAALLATIALGNPVAAPQGAANTCTSKTVQTCATAMQSWSDSPSYCASVLKIPPKTATLTLAQSTVTATATAGSTTITVVKTFAVCSGANQKRQATTTTKTTSTKPEKLPSPLSKCLTTAVPKACSCLGLTTANTVTSTVYKNKVAATTTVTPSQATSTIAQSTTITVGGSGSQPLFLPRPTSLTGRKSDGTADQFYDDTSLYLPELPFNITLYGVSTSTLAVTIDGWIALVTDRSKIPSMAGWRNIALPASADDHDGSARLPDVVYAPWWNELNVHPDTTEDVVYQISDNEVSVEWYVSQFRDINAKYHFLATFKKSNPGAAIFKYFQMAKGHNPYEQRWGTVGVQKYSDNKFAQYSYDKPVAAGTQLYYNPATNTFEDQSNGKCPNEGE